MEFKVCRKEDIPDRKRSENFGKYDNTIKQIELLSVECVKIEATKETIDRIRNGMAKACKRLGSIYKVISRGTDVYVYKGNI